MAIRIKHRVWLQAFEDAAEKNKLFAPDPELSEVIATGFDKQASGNITVADSSNKNIDLSDVTAVKGIWLKLDGEATLKINGSTDSIQLRLKSGGAAGTDFAKFFIEAEISSVNIANATGAAVNGVFCAWGDPTP